MQTEVSATINPDAYQYNLENAFGNAQIATNIGSAIISVIRVIGIIVTVVVLLILGIKYMTGSVEEKADYKKSMIPYLVGVFIFFTLSQILTIIMQLVSNLN